jgi:hypothetical protein
MTRPRHPEIRKLLHQYHDGLTALDISERLLDGQDKALVIEARRVLPKTYKNSFEKGKNA